MTRPQADGGRQGRTDDAVAPQPAADRLALDRARDQWEPETLLAEVQRVWGDAVGPAIAAGGAADQPSAAAC